MSGADLERLDFRLVQPRTQWYVEWPDTGVRMPATTNEIKLWQRVVELEKQIIEAG